jgi:hypothetical protein
MLELSSCGRVAEGMAVLSRRYEKNGATAVIEYTLWNVDCGCKQMAQTRKEECGIHLVDGRIIRRNVA